MTDYFAHEEALEPALAVICEVLRNNEDIGAVLEKRAATFFSWAQPYEKRRSKADPEICVEKASQNRFTRRPRRRPRGFCYLFQKRHYYIRNCPYRN